MVFRGPYGIVRSKKDNRLVKLFDFRNLHSIISDRVNTNIMRICDEQTPDLLFGMVFVEMRERDMAHLKIGTWMSYWETLKTNKVDFAELRGF